MIIEFIEKCNLIEDSVNNFNTLEHFMKIVFSAQLVLTKIDELRAVSIMSELVDNINKASLETDRYTKQGDETENIIIAKVDVPENAYELLKTIYKAIPGNDDLGFYVSMLDKMFTVGVAANAGDNSQEAENEEEHLVECDESEASDLIVEDNDIDPLISPDDIEDFTENEDDEEDILDVDTLNKLTDVMDSLEKTSADEDLELARMVTEACPSNVDTEDLDFVASDFEEESGAEDSDGDTATVRRDFKIVEKTDKDDNKETH